MWVEGVSNNRRILNDLAKIFTTSNKDEFGAINKGKNWELIYPSVHAYKTITNEELMNIDADQSKKTYQAPVGKRKWSDMHRIDVFEEDATGAPVLLPSNTYTIDYVKGIVTFQTSRTRRIRANFTYSEFEKDIYQVINSIQNRVVLRTTIDAQSADSADDPFGNDLDQHAKKMTIYVELFQSQFVHNPEKPITNPNTYSVSWVDDETGQSFTHTGLTHDGYQIEMGVGGKPQPNFHYVHVRYFNRWDADKLQPGKQVVDYLTCPVVDRTTGSILFHPTDPESIRRRRMKENGVLVERVLHVNAYTGEIGYFNNTNTWIPVTTYVDYDTNRTVVLYVDIESGTILIEGGKTSDWMKWSWYRDYEEILADMIDSDPSLGDLNDGMVFRYIDTPGLNKQVVPIKFHASVDNTKAAIVLQGDPSLNFDNYLITFGYFGSIDSYFETYHTAEMRQDPITGEPVPVPVENKDFYSNDTAGNFLVTVGSSTNPAKKVKRDVITGAVIDVEFDNSWGVNTSDGVTDFSMFKTRSGLFFQKHHPAFVTPEQFLEKEMFNPSRWTGAYNLSQVHVVHGHDGYRGIMRNVVVVDDLALDHENELIVKEKQAEQKIYKFFAVNTPYSFIRNSPNVQYGIAILKE